MNVKGPEILRPVASSVLYPHTFFFFLVYFINSCRYLCDMWKTTVYSTVAKCS